MPRKRRGSGRWPRPRRGARTVGGAIIPRVVRRTHHGHLRPPPVGAGGRAPCPEFGMQETMLSLGRGIAKTFISLLIGSGVGLLTFGISVRDMHDLWEPPGLFTATGAGLLATGATMVLLFSLP